MEIIESVQMDKSDASFLLPAILLSLLLHGGMIGAMAGMPHGFPGTEKKVDRVVVTYVASVQSLLPSVTSIDNEKQIKKEVKAEPKTVVAEPLGKNNSKTESVQKQVSTEASAKESVEAKENQLKNSLRYQDTVKQRIEAARLYPAWAMKNGIQGVVRLTFTVSGNGGVSDLKMIHSSGSKILDDAALSAVTRAAPFQPFPESLKINSLSMVITLVFKLNG